jgi:chromosome segregation ATPase
MADLELLPEDFEKRLAEYQTASKKVFDSSSTLEEAHQRLEKVRTELKLREEDTSKFDEQYQDTIRERLNLEAQLGEIKKNLQETTQRQAGLEAQNQKLQQQLDKLAQRLGQVEKQDAMPAWAKEQQTQLTAMARQIEEHKETIQLLKKETAQAQDQFKKSLQALEQQAAQRQEQFDKQQKTMQEAVGQLKSCQVLLEQFKTQFTDLNAKIAKLERSVSKARPDVFDPFT